MKIVVGVSGASGSVYGYRLLEKLRAAGTVETHLVLTRPGERTGWLEMGVRAADCAADTPAPQQARATARGTATAKTLTADPTTPTPRSGARWFSSSTPGVAFSTR